MMVDVRKEDENLSQGCNNSVCDAVDGDSKVSVEKFDDAMAALTFTAMALTIALGFLFHL